MDYSTTTSPVRTERILDLSKENKTWDLESDGKSTQVDVDNVKSKPGQMDLDAIENKKE